MNRSILARTFSLALLVAPLWSAPFHHRGATDPATPDPQLDAFMMGAALILVTGSFLLFVGGPLLILLTRRVRYTLLLVPALNFFFYALSISLRPYPGGFFERFIPPGLWFTMGEAFLLLLSTFLVTLLLAAAHWVVQKLRTWRKKDQAP
ncbi:MAG: hypothetical protein J0L75_13485 [Spirochaetes bacterium]|nr:hypothetical protein [Spirochaetota bacterium]